MAARGGGSQEALLEEAVGVGAAALSTCRLSNLGPSLKGRLRTAKAFGHLARNFPEIYASGDHCRVVAERFTTTCLEDTTGSSLSSVDGGPAPARLSPQVVRFA